jgi:peptidoglycan/xylan/chitin deacetylase (PgdA/CDA1 family)
VKARIKRVLARSGVSQVSRFLNRSRGLILMYHGLTEQAVSHEWNQVTLEAFDAQMTCLKKRYNVVPLDVMIDKMAAGRLPPYTAAITFDDGYRSVFDLAYPVLVRHSLPATVYIVTYFVGPERHRYLWTDHITVLLFARLGTELDLSSFDLGRYSLKSENEVFAARQEITSRLKLAPDRHRKDILNWLIRDHDAAIDHERFGIYQPMTWDEVTELGAGDLVTIGAHTQTHPILSQVSLSSLQEEIIGSLEDINTHLGDRPQHFAYPNGRAIDFTPEALALVRRVFRSATTTVRGLNPVGTDLHLLRRVGVGGSLSKEEFSALLSGLYFPGR